MESNKNKIERILNKRIDEAQFNVDQMNNSNGPHTFVVSWQTDLSFNKGRLAALESIKKEIEKCLA